MMGAGALRSALHRPCTCNQEELLGTVHDYTNTPVRLLMSKRGQECRRAIAAKEKSTRRSEKSSPWLER